MPAFGNPVRAAEECARADLSPRAPGSEGRSQAFSDLKAIISKLEKERTMHARVIEELTNVLGKKKKEVKDLMNTNMYLQERVKNLEMTLGDRRKSREKRTRSQSACSISGVYPDFLSVLLTLEKRVKPYCELMLREVTVNITDEHKIDEESVAEDWNGRAVVLEGHPFAVGVPILQ